MIMSTRGEADVVHNVVRNAAETGLGKSGPTSHIKKIGLPPCHFSV